MEFHINGEPKDISRYVFCPGSQSRAKKIADHFDDRVTVSDDRGIVVYSGTYQGVFMTSCGTGMGGPATGIALEELGHLGADTFIRVGSCGVLQQEQQPGDIIIAIGTYRATGTGLSYLPPEFPAVADFSVVRALVESAESLQIPVRTGVGMASDGFYGTRRNDEFEVVREANGLFIEMESDTVFLIGQLRGWRTGAIFASDGAAGEIKPEWGVNAYREGEQRMIEIALAAMLSIAEKDSKEA